MRSGVPAGPVLVALAALVVGGCWGNFAYPTSAPPIVETKAFVEQSPEVAAALGSPVTVSLAVTRDLERSPLGFFTGHDHVTLDTKVSGSRGEGRLRVSAMNIDDQGWDGTFRVEVEGRRVRNAGGYVTEGGGSLLEGKIAADGRPLVAHR